MSRIRKFVNTILVPENFREGGAYDSEFKKKRSGGSFKDTFGVDSLPELINDYGGTGVGEEFNKTSTGDRLFGKTIHHGKETEEKVFWNVRQDAGPSSLQAALKTSKMPYMRKRMRRGRFKRRFKRRYSRRRRGSRFGLRVRRQAIKLSEPKYHRKLINLSLNNVFAGATVSGAFGDKTTPQVCNASVLHLNLIPHTDIGPNTNESTDYNDFKLRRIGDVVFMRGIKLRLHINGTAAGTEEKYLRFALFTPKNYMGADAVNTPGKIFSNPQKYLKHQNYTAKTLYDEGTTSAIEAAMAPINRTQLKVWKEWKIRLHGNDTVERGDDVVAFNMWIPINKYLKFENQLTASSSMNIPIFLYTHWFNKQLGSAATNQVSVSGASTIYFRDP